MVIVFTLFSQLFFYSQYYSYRMQSFLMSYQIISCKYIWMLVGNYRKETKKNIAKPTEDRIYPSNELSIL